MTQWDESGLLVAFSIEGGPIRHAAVQHPDVNVVEMIFGVDPFAAAVVNLKAEIGGNAVRLNGRQIGA